MAGFGQWLDDARGAAPVTAARPSAETTKANTPADKPRPGPQPSTEPRPPAPGDAAARPSTDRSDTDAADASTDAPSIRKDGLSNDATDASDAAKVETAPLAPAALTAVDAADAEAGAGTGTATTHTEAPSVDADRRDGAAVGANAAGLAASPAADRARAATHHDVHPDRPSDASGGLGAQTTTKMGDSKVIVPIRLGPAAAANAPAPLRADASSIAADQRHGTAIGATAAGLAASPGADRARAAKQLSAHPDRPGDASGGFAAPTTTKGDAGLAVPAQGGPASDGNEPATVRTDAPSVIADRRDVAGAGAATPATGSTASAATDARPPAQTGLGDGAGPSAALSAGAHATPAGAPGASTPPDGAARASALPADTLPAPLHSAAFAPALAARVVVMLREGTREARLQLNPAELGPINVRISVDGSQARVDLVAEQAPTRSVLEQALPSLAGALRDSGLTLSGGGVFDAPRDGQRNGRDEPAGPRGTATTGADDGPGDPAGPGIAPARHSPRGMLDLYA
jgi:flagellar hook-length control protein FliK